MALRKAFPRNVDQFVDVNTEIAIALTTIMGTIHVYLDRT